MQKLTSLNIVFKIPYGKASVSNYTSLEIGESIKQLKHLRSLSIGCDCRRFRGTECYCANIISISAGYLSDLRKLELSRHIFRKSNALQLKASLSELKQLTHLTLDESIYEEGTESPIDLVSSVNQVENLIIHRWCWFDCDRFVYEAEYSLQTILWYHRPGPICISFDETNLTHLASVLTTLDHLRYLEVKIACIEYQKAIDVYTAVTSHSSSCPLQLKVNPFKKKDSTMLWKEIR